MICSSCFTRNSITQGRNKNNMNQTDPFCNFNYFVVLPQYSQLKIFRFDEIGMIIIAHVINGNVRWSNNVPLKHWNTISRMHETFHVIVRRKFNIGKICLHSGGRDNKRI